MKNSEAQPLDKNFICSNELENQNDSVTESIPVFLLPFGFHSLSLLQIAQYYDGSATNFYKNIIFMNNSNNNQEDFSKHKICDYSLFFQTIIQNFHIPRLIQPSQYIKLCDRFFDANFLLSLPPLGDLSFNSYYVPKGKEDGIAYILSQSRDFLKPHLFSLMSIPFSSISAKITITAGQPFLLNKILSSAYSNVESINSRKESFINDMNNLRYYEYQMDWSIVSTNGLVSLILVRPPQFLKISDRNLELFDTIEKAFENSNVCLVCYRHSKFIKHISFDISTQSPEIDGPLKSDSFFSNLLKSEMKRNLNEKSSMDFESYLIYSLRFPSFYLMNCGFERDISMAASVFIDDQKGRAASLFLPLLRPKSSKNEDERKEKNLYPIENAPAPASTIFGNHEEQEARKEARKDSNENESLVENDNYTEIKVENNNNNSNDDDANGVKVTDSNSNITNDKSGTGINYASNSDSNLNEVADNKEGKVEGSTENFDNDDEGSKPILISPFQNQEEAESKLLSYQTSQLDFAVQEYFKFCFWLRSFISVIKRISRRDLNGIAECSLSCFRSLPLRNRRVVVSTILLLTESLRKFRKTRSPNDDFYQKVLRIFKSLFGEEFDQVLGLQKWEVPREMRSQVVCVDNCVKMFYVRQFKNEKISINNAIFRLTKYMDPVMNEISLDQEVPNFKFCQSYIDFLKLQKFEKVIEI